MQARVDAAVRARKSLESEVNELRDELEMSSRAQLEVALSVMLSSYTALLAVLLIAPRSSFCLPCTF